jgi:hypothetical protein
MNQNEDTLRDQLHEEAMAERPPFSSEVHQRIMQRVRNSQSVSKSLPPMRPSRRLEVAAAAICIAAGVLSLTWGVHSIHTRALNTVLKITGNPQPKPDLAAAPPTSIPLTLNIGGIFSARLWPPELSVRLPISGAGRLPPAQQLPAPSYDPPGSPEWLFARLEQPATSAQMALADMIPPDLRALAGLAKLRQ